MNIFKDVIRPASVQIVVAAALLTAFGMMAAYGTVSSSTTYNVTMAVTGGGAVLAGLVLGNPSVPNANLVPHLLLSLMLIGMMVGMSLSHVFSDNQIQGLVSALLVGGGIAYGSAAGLGVVTSLRATGAHSVRKSSVKELAAGEVPEAQVQE